MSTGLSTSQPVLPRWLHTADGFARIKRYVFEELTEPWVSAFSDYPVASLLKLLVRWLVRLRMSSMGHRARHPGPDAQGVSDADVPVGAILSSSLRMD
ncbi:uncharacterized protein ARMOST_21868 [Armillaria ostoyae]|uniref:Uncharacterized protein n=1 Tax=Armillaria ostoyae TaxID=47428 RepID=A0A284SB92_ARMOS|nr:uncharacterized protein ARMOST_21868 [Armillaria ostoyae]